MSAVHVMVELCSICLNTFSTGGACNVWLHDRSGDSGIENN